jgi:2-methylcitrate dehydratase PrpD
MSSTVGVTEDLARFVHDSPREGGIPEAAVTKALKAIIETFADVLLGAASEAAPPLFRYLKQSGSQGEAIVLGTNMRTSPEMAALTNGAFGAALEHGGGFGHPASVIVPALCAEASRRRMTGMEFIDAFVIGCEAGDRLAFGVGAATEQALDYRATSTLSTCYALAAVARLRALPVDTIRTAIGIAFTMTGDGQCEPGAMMQSLHAGWAARCGIAAVDLAASGYRASRCLLDAQDGDFFKVRYMSDARPESEWNAVGERFKRCATAAGLTPAVASHLMLRLGDLRSARDMQSLLMAMRPEL